MLLASEIKQTVAKVPVWKRSQLLRYLLEPEIDQTVVKAPVWKRRQLRHFLLKPEIGHTAAKVPVWKKSVSSACLALPPSISVFFRSFVGVLLG